MPDGIKAEALRNIGISQVTLDECDLPGRQYELPEPASRRAVRYDTDPVVHASIISCVQSRLIA
jgi:hypothetical protein